MLDPQLCQALCPCPASCQCAQFCSWCAAMLCQLACKLLSDTMVLSSVLAKPVFCFFVAYTQIHWHQQELVPLERQAAAEQVCQGRSFGRCQPDLIAACLRDIMPSTLLSLQADSEITCRCGLAQTSTNCSGTCDF